MTDTQDIHSKILTEITDLQENRYLVITSETRLIGDDSVLDSMKLVELCLFLEDYASEQDFEFNWTSTAAMSKSRGMFRTAGALIAEFISQRDAQR
jgi:hypothetical protein